MLEMSLTAWRAKSAEIGIRPEDVKVQVQGQLVRVWPTGLAGELGLSILIESVRQDAPAARLQAYLSKTG